MKIKREENPRAEISWLWMIQTRNFFKLLFQLCSGTKQEQIEPSYLNGDPAYNFQIGGNDYVIYFEGTFMYQRIADPEVQAVYFVRRRPMFASRSALQTTVRWVNADCALIVKSYKFFLKVPDRETSYFVDCLGTELGFRSIKSRNIIMVKMMMMIIMIWIIDSLHVSGWCVQHCCLSIRSPWTQLKQVHLRKILAVTSNAYIIHIFILRLTENLMQAELFAIQALLLFLYWRRGLGKSVWGIENA